VLAIEEFIRVDKANPKLFLWTKNVDEILEKVAHCRAITVTLPYFPIDTNGGV
jgi:hypothetical protein